MRISDWSSDVCSSDLDLADAAVCWLEAAPAPPATYELDDCHPGGYNWSAIAAIAARVRNVPVRCVAVPVVLLKTIAHIKMSLSRFGRSPPMSTLSTAGELVHPFWSCALDVGSVGDRWFGTC